MGADQVRVLARILSILQLNGENQHNLKQYKVLIDRLLDRIKNKASIKYLEKLKSKIEKLETNTDALLNDEELSELEAKRKIKVDEIAQEHLMYLSDSEKEEIEQRFGVELVDKDESEEEVESSMATRKKQLRTTKQLRTDHSANISILNADNEEESVSLEPATSQRTSNRQSRKKKKK